MFGSEVVDVGIGMALLFLFMSLIASALRELIEAKLKTRATDLERGIVELLRTPDAQGQQQTATPTDHVKDFYEHPLIASLYRGRYAKGSTDLPSYIPRQSFALAALDMVAKVSATGDELSVAGLRRSLDKSDAPASIKRVVGVALSTAGNDLNQVRKTIEDWYDGTMDRVSGWYTRRTSYILGALGLLAAVVFNVDAITIGQRLIEDKALRQAAVAAAEKYLSENKDNPAEKTTKRMKDASTGDKIKDEPTPSVQGEKLEDESPSEATRNGAAQPFEKVAALRNELVEIGYPIGWVWRDGRTFYPGPQMCRPKALPAAKAPPVANAGQEYDCDPTVSKWFSVILGWIITALAITMGAPFWFDVLNKFMVVRSTVKPKEKSPDEASEDRQLRPLPPVQAPSPKAP